MLRDRDESTYVLSFIRCHVCFQSDIYANTQIVTDPGPEAFPKTDPRPCPPFYLVSIEKLQSRNKFKDQWPDSMLTMQGPGVQTLVRELDLACHKKN